MKNVKLLVLGSLVAASALVIGGAGCGDDDEDSGGTGATGATSSSTGTAASGNSGGNPSGGGTPSSGGGGSTGEGGNGGGMVSAECATYCSTMETNCAGDNDQWGATVPGMCEAVCMTWAPGMEGDVMGNTVGCHQYHAEASAGMGANMHCIHAGPVGDGQCGDACENFCELAMAVCAGTFADEPTCMTTCEDFPDVPEYSAATVSGDSFACRLYHLTAAAADDSHCAHIVADSPTCMPE